VGCTQFDLSRTTGSPGQPPRSGKLCVFDQRRAATWACTPQFKDITLLTCNILTAHAAHCGEIPNMDPLLITIDNALRTLFSKPLPGRSFTGLSPSSLANRETLQLTETEKRLSGALMRVNHVGEVCAQALYASQTLATNSPSLKKVFSEASAEEFDHLAWTEARIDDLLDHKSYLNPLWYMGAFGIGYLAGKIGGDKMSLGFVVETERQVSEHLKGHLSALPANDSVSREIVKQMIIDEEGHAKLALAKGARELPSPIKGLMRFAGKVMTRTAHYL